ncbi:MAG TPA: hypothetical protein VLM89_05055 [Phycisphaerae bacterium]|nr:hypothetical protein [Phycisphaerae bacterium]
MSATPVKIWTRCPVCRSRYQVIPEAIGNIARCKRCQARFRVEEHNPHPTEDDILRWLNEATEQEDANPHPKVISGRMGSPAKAAPSPAAAPATVQRVVVHHVRTRLH